jgi:RNA polymerase sigma factor (sigma-70 family)
MNQRPRELGIGRLLEQTSWAARLARTLVGPEGADDLLQDVWVQTLAIPPKEMVESPRAWLATILRRGAARQRRSAGRRADRERSAAREEALPDTTDLQAREADRRELVEATLELPEPLRDVLVLRYFDEFAPKEIAAKLGVPASTVRSRLQRGLAALRERLERERGEEWRGWCLALLPAGAGGAAEKVLTGKLLLLLGALAAVVVVLIGFWPGGGAPPDEGRSEEMALLPLPEDRKDETHTVDRRETERIAVVVDAAASESAADRAPADPRVYVVRGLCLDESKRPVAGIRAVAADLLGAPSAVSGTDGRFVLPLIAPSPLRGPSQLETGGGVQLGMGEEPIRHESTRGRATTARLLFAGKRYRAGMKKVELEAEREIDLGCVELIPAPRSIRGRVFTGDDLPAAGAHVYLMRNIGLGASEEEVLRCGPIMTMVIPVGDFGFVETGSDGRFLLPAVPEAPVRLCVFLIGHDGLTTAPVETDAGNQLDLGDLELLACHPERSVGGRIITASGDAVPSAWVSSRCLIDGGRVQTRGALMVADSDGAFCVPVPEGSFCRLTAFSSHGSALADGVAAGTTDLTLVIDSLPEAELPKVPAGSGTRVAGSVQRGGEGIPDACISAWKITASGRTTLHATARSGAEGRFEIVAPDTNSCRLRADFGPWDEPELAEWGPVALNPGEVRSAVVLDLSAAGSISGEVIASDVESLIGTKVSARSEGRHDRSATIGAEGDFHFASLPPGSYRLVSAALQRFDDEEAEGLVVEVKSGETARVTIDLSGEESCRVVGRFSIDGEAPSDAWELHVSSGTRRHSPPLDTRGNFSAAPLEPGRMRLHAVCRSNPPRILLLESQLAAGTNCMDIELTTGRLELEGFPLPDDPEFDGVTFTTFLTWEGSDGMTWSAYLIGAQSGALSLDEIPAGTIQLRHQFEAINDPKTVPIVAEVEVRVGETSRLVFPE